MEAKLAITSGDLVIGSSGDRNLNPIARDLSRRDVDLPIFRSPDCGRGERL